MNATAYRLGPLVFPRPLVVCASAAGYGVALAALILIAVGQGGLGYDVHAYWLAGRHILDGAPLYSVEPITTYGAFRYPPLFAQLAAPFALLPEPVFSWLWRIVCVGALRYLAGSWLAMGLWLLVPFTLTELSSANVTFPVAAATLMAFRGGAALLPAAALLKFGPILALPYLWLARPECRRDLVIGAATISAFAVISVLLDPGAWAGYIQSLGYGGGYALDDRDLLRILPQALPDFALRFGLGVVLTAVALRYRADWLAYAATIVAAPILWMSRLVPLLAALRLPGTRFRG